MSTTRTLEFVILEHGFLGAHTDLDHIQVILDNYCRQLRQHDEKREHPEPQSHPGSPVEPLHRGGVSCGCRCHGCGSPCTRRGGGSEAHERDADRCCTSATRAVYASRCASADGLRPCRVDRDGCPGPDALHSHEEPLADPPSERKRSTKAEERGNEAKNLWSFAAPLCPSPQGGVEEAGDGGVFTEMPRDAEGLDPLPALQLVLQPHSGLSHDSSGDDGEARSTSHTNASNSNHTTKTPKPANSGAGDRARVGRNIVVLNHAGNNRFLCFPGVATCAERLVTYAFHEIERRVIELQEEWELDVMEAQQHREQPQHGCAARRVCHCHCRMHHHHHHHSAVRTTAAEQMHTICRVVNPSGEKKSPTTDNPPMRRRRRSTTIQVSEEGDSKDPAAPTHDGIATSTAAEAGRERQQEEEAKNTQQDSLIVNVEGGAPRDGPTHTVPPPCMERTANTSTPTATTTAIPGTTTGHGTPEDEGGRTGAPSSCVPVLSGPPPPVGILFTTNNTFGKASSATSRSSGHKNGDEGGKPSSFCTDARSITDDCHGRDWTSTRTSAGGVLIEVELEEKHMDPNRDYRTLPPVVACETNRLPRPPLSPFGNTVALNSELLTAEEAGGSTLGTPNAVGPPLSAANGSLATFSALPVAVLSVASPLVPPTSRTSEWSRGFPLTPPGAGETDGRVGCRHPTPTATSLRSGSSFFPEELWSPRELEAEDSSLELVRPHVESSPPPHEEHKPSEEVPFGAAARDFPTAGVSLAGGKDTRGGCFTAVGTQHPTCPCCYHCEVERRAAGGEPLHAMEKRAPVMTCRLVFHVLGYSLGGLVVRAALPDLMEKLRARYAAAPLPGAPYRYELHWKTFFSLCCPHMGSSQPHPMIRWSYRLARYLHVVCLLPTVVSDMFLQNDYVEQVLLSDRHLMALKAFNRRIFIAVTHDRMVWNYSSAFVLPPVERRLLQGWKPQNPSFNTARPLAQHPPDDVLNSATSLPAATRCAVGSPRPDTEARVGDAVKKRKTWEEDPVAEAELSTAKKGCESPSARCSGVAGAKRPATVVEEDSRLRCHPCSPTEVDLSSLETQEHRCSSTTAQSNTWLLLEEAAERRVWEGNAAFFTALHLEPASCLNELLQQKVIIAQESVEEIPVDDNTTTTTIQPQTEEEEEEEVNVKKTLKSDQTLGLVKNWITEETWPKAYLPRERAMAIHFLHSVGPLELHFVDMHAAVERHLERRLIRDESMRLIRASRDREEREATQRRRPAEKKKEKKKQQCWPEPKAQEQTKRIRSPHTPIEEACEATGRGVERENIALARDEEVDPAAASHTARKQKEHPPPTDHHQDLEEAHETKSHKGFFSSLVARWWSGGGSSSSPRSKSAAEEADNPRVASESLSTPKKRNKKGTPPQGRSGNRGKKGNTGEPCRRRASRHWAASAYVFLDGPTAKQLLRQAWFYGHQMVIDSGYSSSEIKKQQTEQKRFLAAQAKKRSARKACFLKGLMQCQRRLLWLRRHTNPSTLPHPVRSRDRTSSSPQWTSNPTADPRRGAPVSTTATPAQPYLQSHLLSSANTATASPTSSHVAVSPWLSHSTFFPDNDKAATTTNCLAGSHSEVGGPPPAPLPPPPLPPSAPSFGFGCVGCGGGCCEVEPDATASGISSTQTRHGEECSTQDNGDGSGGGFTVFCSCPDSSQPATALPDHHTSHDNPSCGACMCCCCCCGGGGGCGGAAPPSSRWSASRTTSPARTPPPPPPPPLPTATIRQSFCFAFVSDFVVDRILEIDERIKDEPQHETR